MLKWILAVLVALACCLLVFCLLAGQAERTSYIKQHRYMLKIAAEDLAKYGYVTNIWTSVDRFYRSSNVVTIAGTQYQCYAEVRGGEFENEGSLAITTNEIFIWLSSNGPPKIIDIGYRAALGHF